jgi:hypothetical protein
MGEDTGEGETSGSRTLPLTPSASSGQVLALPQGARRFYFPSPYSRERVRVRVTILYELKYLAYNCIGVLKYIIVPESQHSESLSI